MTFVWILLVAFLYILTVAFLWGYLEPRYPCLSAESSALPFVALFWPVVLPVCALAYIFGYVLVPVVSFVYFIGVGDKKRRYITLKELGEI